MPRVSRLVNDLTSVPAIIGNLGLSVAAAQRAFNLDYLESIERLLGLAKLMLGGYRLDDGNPAARPDDDARKLEEFSALLQTLVQSLAPARYQFTETTLAVRLDLAQTMSASAAGSLGVGVGAVTVNATMAVGYGYDYRAAAEVKTVLHAQLPDRAVFQALLERAAQINATALTLPEPADVDKEIMDTSSRIADKLIA